MKDFSSQDVGTQTFKDPNSQDAVGAAHASPALIDADSHHHKSTQCGHLPLTIISPEFFEMSDDAGSCDEVPGKASVMFDAIAEQPT
eukprot:11702324-Karenia_brevis.AAC.1